MTQSVPGPLVAQTAERLMLRADDLAAELVAVIVSEIDFYAAGTVVARADLHRSVVQNFTFMLNHLIRTAPVDLSAPTETGRQRAAQNAPLPEILRAYRLGFAFLWGQLLAEARRSGEESLSALLDTATSIWALADDYSMALTDAYRTAMAEHMVENDRRRSALVAALVDGSVAGQASAWEIAKLLDFPFEGRFLVVVVETTRDEESPLIELESQLGALGVASAWRVHPDHEVGVLSCGRRRPVARVIDALRAIPASRVGVSPAYERLEETPRARRFAQVAFETQPRGIPGLRQLTDSPLTELVIANRESTRRMVHRVLGDVLTIPEDDRNLLLSTARAWLAASGSASEAGRVLFCHPNTVRYRMRRLEEHLGHTLDDSRRMAELAVALEALDAFPELVARPVSDVST